MTEVIITFVIAWLIIPILGELFTTVTTPVLLRVSNGIPGFWDFLAEGKLPQGALGFQDPLTMTDEEIEEIKAKPVPKGWWNT